MPKGVFVDAATGEVIERELTADEIAAITPTDAALTAQRTAQVEALRRGAYAAEADPLFFKWQRGEATQQQWLDKVAEIRARYSDG